MGQDRWGSGDSVNQYVTFTPYLPTNNCATLPTPTQVPDIIVTATEITQGIQDLNNDMPLVDGRLTLARAYVRSDLPTVAGVHARLRAFRGGTELSGSPSYANNIITVRNDGGDRLNLDDSFWFYVPPEWRSGTVTFRVEVNYDRAVPEGDFTNNSLETTVTFQPGQELNLVMVPLQLHDHGTPSLRL